MSPSVQGVKNFLYPPPYCVVCGDMVGSLQYHHMEDYEPLQVPLYVPCLAHLIVQIPDKAAPNLPTRSIVAAGGHDCEVTH